MKNYSVKESHRARSFTVYVIVHCQKRALKYTESLFFLPCLKGANPELNLDLFKHLFLIKPVKGVIY